jgi:hypothetical protein
MPNLCENELKRDPDEELDGEDDPVDRCPRNVRFLFFGFGFLLFGRINRLSPSKPSS